MKIVNDRVKRKTLSDFFKTVNVEENELDPPPMVPRTSEVLVDVEITVAEVEDLLGHLNESKAAGPDRIHPKVLREAKEELSETLVRLFRNSSEFSEINGQRLCPRIMEKSRSCSNLQIWKENRPEELQTSKSNQPDKPDKILEKLIRNGG